MKTLLFLTILFGSIAYGQPITKSQIVGIWQKGDSLVGAIYGESYQFFRNGSFVFHTNAFDALQRIKELKGRYTLKDDTLYLYLTSTVELVGGRVEPASPPVSSEWEITGYRTVETECDSSTPPDIMAVKRCKQGKAKCLLLDGIPYYKTSDDPGDF